MLQCFVMSLQRIRQATTIILHSFLLLAFQVIDYLRQSRRCAVSSEKMLINDRLNQGR